MFLRDTGNISERTAIIDAFGKQFTYGELERLSMEYQAQIPERSLAMILCDYSIETVAFYYCQMSNHVVTMLVDKNLNKELLTRLIQTYEPQFIWCAHKVKDQLKDFAAQIVLQRDGHALVRTPFQPYRMNPKLALLLTTSGSTGSLKLVRLSYENLRCNIRAFIKTVELKESDRGITTMPMHYCFGLSVLHMHWMLGACIYITEYSVMNIKFWKFFEKSRITSLFGVPYTLNMLRQVGFLDKEYHFLRFVLQGGGKLTDQIQTEFGMRLKEKGIRFYTAYGQTEATTYISVLSYKKVIEKTGSVGEPLPGIDISVLNPNGQGEGELVCQGAVISLGYADDKKDLALDDENKERLYTGDIVSVDQEGDIFIKGRKARFVKVLGARISLDELESVLTRRFLEIPFACVGEDDRIRIYCSKEGLEESILGFCRERLSLPGKVTECRYIEKLPYLGNGKIDYQYLKEDML